MDGKVVMAAKSSDRQGTRPTLVAIHTNEGPNPADVFPDRTAENLARWMNDQEVSYHKVVDDDSVVNYVSDGRYSWSLRSGNRRSLNLCLMGYSRFTHDEWLRHLSMLKLAAAEVREWCDKYGIPIRKLSPADVGRDQSGICGHVDWTLGKKDGNHTDPGEGFPWDVFISFVKGQENPDMPLTQDDIDKVRVAVRDSIMHMPINRQGPGQSGTTTLAAGVAWIDYLTKTVSGEELSNILTALREASDSLSEAREKLAAEIKKELADQRALILNLAKK
jgi:hypothetical protein